MKKRIFATLLALVMALGLTATAWADDPVTSVTYVDADGKTQTCTDYTVVNTSDESVIWGEAGQTKWYVVKDNVNIGYMTENSKNFAYVTVTGEVHLILCDSATLTVNGCCVGLGGIKAVYGIRLESNSSLTVYGQSNGTGTLDVSKAGHDQYSNDHIDPAGSTAIGLNGGSLTINGGHVMAGCDITGGESTYGLCNGTLIMNGGKLTANSYGGGGNNDPIDNRINITIKSACCKWRTKNTDEYTAGSSIPKQFTPDANDKKYLEIVAGHEFDTVVPATPTTCTMDGNRGHLQCSLCKKHFDAAGNEIAEDADLTIPATGHQFVGRTCTVCGYEEPAASAHEPIRRQNTTAVEDTTDTKDTTVVASPKTFDAGVAVYGAMAVASLLGMGYVGKKRV